MSQTAVTEQSDARLGLLADSSCSIKDSFAAEGAIPFGRLVSRGTSATKECKLPAAATDVTDAKKVLGVALATQNVEIPLNSTAPPQYPDERTVPVLNFGRVYVEVETTTVDTTKDVYVRHTADGAKNKLGGFADAAATGLAKLDNARWLSEDFVDGTTRLALLEIRL